MSEAENYSIARRCMEEFWGRGNASVADEIFAEDCVFHVPSAPSLGHGPQAAKDFMAHVRSGFKDFQTIVDRVITNSDIAIVYGIGHGIHVGEVLGAPPTGKKVTMKGVLTLQIVDGKIINYQAAWDTASFARQIGAKM